jgi:hypothetical protein
MLRCSASQGARRPLQGIQSVFALLKPGIVESHLICLDWVQHVQLKIALVPDGTVELGQYITVIKLFFSIYVRHVESTLFNQYFSSRVWVVRSRVAKP